MPWFSDTLRVHADLLRVWTWTGDVFSDTLRVHADGLHADADECKEKKKKKNLLVGWGR